MSLALQSQIDFLNNPTVWRLLRFFAVDTWDRIKYCRTHMGNSIYETTITQNIVFNFLQMEEAGILPVTIYESRNERTNGNDLEIILQIGNSYLIFPCQAKIVSKEMRYPTLHHLVGERQQAELLLAYAQRIRGIPLYLLYNYSYDEDANKYIEECWQASVKYFGCSFIEANYLYNKYCVKANLDAKRSWRIPDFIELHTNNGAFPFEWIPFFQQPGKLEEFFNTYREFRDFVTDYSHFYHYDIPDDEKWKMIIKKDVGGRIGFITDRSPLHDVSATETAGFNPSYRILIEGA